MKNSGLGKGLGALLSTNVEKISENANKKEELDNEKIYSLKINEVEPNKEQPRKRFEEEKIEELSNSIKEHGVIQPIIVAKKENYYEIIAGERRWRAAKKAGLKEIPAIIKENDEKKNKQISLIENIQRQDLNPIEEAVAIQSLMNEYGFTQEQVSKSIGKSRSSVANTVRLLNLDDKVKKLVEEGKLTEGHCKVLVSQPKEEQLKMALEIIEGKKTVRQLEENIKSKKSSPRKVSKQLDAIYKDIEEQFKNYFGTKVSIKAQKNKGKITIEYFSNEELERILELIK